jgi:hypothetical protein
VVIGSIGSTAAEGWVELAKRIEDTGVPSKMKGGDRVDRSLKGDPPSSDRAGLWRGEDAEAGMEAREAKGIVVRHRLSGSTFTVPS